VTANGVETPASGFIYIHGRRYVGVALLTNGRTKLVAEPEGDKTKATEARFVRRDP
jgi:hypothetical protein